jgi:hypothetical protein
MKSPSEFVIHENMVKKNIVPESQPHLNALFQDELAQNQNSGTSANNERKPNSSFGNASVSTSGDTTLIAQRQGAASGAGGSPATMLRDVKDMRVSVRSDVVAASAAAAVLLCLTACGRGPVEPPGSFANGPSITIQLFVSGQIAPTEGDYLIVLNTNTGTAPNFVNVNFAQTQEQPGEATIVEGYGVNPAPFTHWDQAFVYGSNPNGLPNCSPAPVNGFFYCYKAVSQTGGQTTIKFVPIIMTPNTFTFNPAGNGGSGTGNAIILRLPLSCLSLFGGTAGLSCDQVTPAVTQIYLNFITLDNNGIPQDQLACNAGQTFIIDVTVSNLQQLTKPTNCGTVPPNQDLLITGGLVQVNP